MVEDNQELAQVVDALEEARRTIQQAEASGNIQQMFEAERVLYLAQQRLSHFQAGGDEHKENLQSVQEQLVDGEFFDS